MDGTTSKLKEKLDQLLREAAEVSVAMDRANGTIVGVPHYSVIEARAHQLGQQLSREIQARQMGVLASAQPAFTKCPECGTRCETVPKKTDREIGRWSCISRRAGCRLPQMSSGLFPPSGKRSGLTPVN